MANDRRSFIKKSALGAAALGLASTGFQSLNAQNKEINTSKSNTDDSLITINGACSLPAGTMNPEDITRYIKGGCTAIGMTVSGGNYNADLTKAVLRYAAEQIQTREDLILVRTADDIRAAKKLGKMGIFYHFQGPSPLGINLDNLWYYKQSGVGVVQIPYNTRNPFANGATERVDAGLSILGIKLVEACNKARMIVDVAHTGETSSLDAIEASSEPVIISHGNAIGKINNPRNISDKLLKAIAKNGGFAGVAGYPAFISDNKKPSMDDMIGMIDYMVELMGIDHVSIGMDYDSTTNGIQSETKVKAAYDGMVATGAWDPKTYPEPPFYYPEGIETPDTLYNLTNALKKRGYKDEDIAKIWGGNWLRVMDKVWGDPYAEIIETQSGLYHHH